MPTAIPQHQEDGGSRSCNTSPTADAASAGGTGSVAGLATEGGSPSAIEGSNGGNGANSGVVAGTNKRLRDSVGDGSDGVSNDGTTRNVASGDAGARLGDDCGIKDNAMNGVRDDAENNGTAESTSAPGSGVVGGVSVSDKSSPCENGVGASEGGEQKRPRLDELPSPPPASAPAPAPTSASSSASGSVAPATPPSAKKPPATSTGATADSVEDMEVEELDDGGDRKSSPPKNGNKRHGNANDAKEKADTSNDSIVDAKEAEKNRVLMLRSVHASSVTARKVDALISIRLDRNWPVLPSENGATAAAVAVAAAAAAAAANSFPYAVGASSAAAASSATRGVGAFYDRSLFVAEREFCEDDDSEDDEDEEVRAELQFAQEAYFMEERYKAMNLVDTVFQEMGVVVLRSSHSNDIESGGGDEGHVDTDLLASRDGEFGANRVSSKPSPAKDPPASVAASCGNAATPPPSHAGSSAATPVILDGGGSVSATARPSGTPSKFRSPAVASGGGISADDPLEVDWDDEYDEYAMYDEDEMPISSDDDDDIDDVGVRSALGLKRGSSEVEFLATKRAAAKPPSSPRLRPTGPVRLFPDAVMEAMCSKARAIEREVCDRLDEVGRRWRPTSIAATSSKVATAATKEAAPGSKKATDDGSASAIEVDLDAKMPSRETVEQERQRRMTRPAADGSSSSSATADTFKYFEVASRCPGRLDVRWRLDEHPFNDPWVIENPILFPMVDQLLGGKGVLGALMERKGQKMGGYGNGGGAVLLYAALIFSFPDSSDQPWHTDGASLFPEDRSMLDLPPYAVNVFIPLEDISSELGPTEFLPSSHKSSNAETIDENVFEWAVHNERAAGGGAEANAGEQDRLFLEEEEWMERNKVVAPALRKGDALIYDHRACHRGTRNLSMGTTRPMLHLLYTRPWFKEHINFGTERLFPS